MINQEEIVANNTKHNFTADRCQITIFNRDATDDLIFTEYSTGSTDTIPPLDSRTYDYTSEHMKYNLFSTATIIVNIVMSIPSKREARRNW